MSKILDRYSSAVHARSLKSDPRTTWSDTDVLGAAGLAAKHEPLGIALARLLSGGGVGGVIEVMTKASFKRARTMNIKLSNVQARDLATAVLAWYRWGTCQPCSGHGYKLIAGTLTLSDDDQCPHCRGTGKVPFDAQFKQDQIDLAKWLSGEIERAQAAAGDLAMRKISNDMDF